MFVKGYSSVWNYRHASDAAVLLLAKGCWCRLQELQLSGDSIGAAASCLCSAQLQSLQCWAALQAFSAHVWSSLQWLDLSGNNEMPQCCSHPTFFNISLCTYLQFFCLFLSGKLSGPALKSWIYPTLRLWSLACFQQTGPTLTYHGTIDFGRHVHADYEQFIISITVTVTVGFARQRLPCTTLCCRMCLVDLQKVLFLLANYALTVHTAGCHTLPKCFLRCRLACTTMSTSFHMRVRTAQ